jgi:uncharacterized YigZ family protein
MPLYALAAHHSLSQEIKRSRFLAIAGPVASEEDARAFIASNSVADANHNCWAWRIGQAYRFNDDGEPSGTAGKPILQAIDGKGLDQVAVVVTRWFGGVLLGSGGLVRAYGGTAALCLQAAEKTKIVPAISVGIELVFADLALVKARLLAMREVSITQEVFTACGAVLTVSLPCEDADAALHLVTDLTRGRAMIDRGD